MNIRAGAFTEAQRTAQIKARENAQNHTAASIALQSCRDPAVRKQITKLAKGQGRPIQSVVDEISARWFEAATRVRKKRKALTPEEVKARDDEDNAFIARWEAEARKRFGL